MTKVSEAKILDGYVRRVVMDVNEHGIYLRRANLAVVFVGKSVSSVNTADRLRPGRAVEIASA